MRACWWTFESATAGIDELPRRCCGEADQVDHDIGPPRRDPGAESSFGVLAGQRPAARLADPDLARLARRIAHRDHRAHRLPRRAPLPACSSSTTPPRRTPVAAAPNAPQ